MYAKRTTSYLLLFQGYPPVLGAIRRQHRHRRICLQQVQPKSEVTDHLPKPKTKRNRGMAVEIRTTVCEIFLNGWRSSQKIRRTQNCMHPHTFLRTQSRNVPRKWYQNQGSTVLKHSFPKRPKRRNGEGLPRAEKFGDLVTADHKVLSENCESRNNHRYAVVVQDLATQWNQSCACKTNFSGNRKELTKVSRVLQSGLDERWWFRLYGMLSPSAKCPGPPGRWGKRHTKDVLENHSNGQSKTQKSNVSK